jgi:FAD/FMN-containing dehydrogenase
MANLQLRGLDGQDVPIDDQALAGLQASLRVPLLVRGRPPSDDAVDDACRIWNGMITERPVLVARPSGNADVIACVNFARERNVLLCVKGGGHNVAGTALADGALMLDMSLMKGVFVDRASKTVRVQAGCLLGDIDRETQVHGLAAVLGFVSETGVAGLTLGGGFGYLTRRYGWTVDNLLEVELVTADGRLRRAAADEHEDLFWALRGGGGNFGVATSFVFRLFEVGPRIMGGLIAWDGRQADEVLAFFKEFTAKAPRALTCASTMRLAPPAPFLPKEWHGKPIVGVVACHTGALEQARVDLAPLKSFGKPIVDLVVEKNYLEQQRMLDATQPKGMHYYWKSEYVSGLSDDLLAVARSKAAEIASPMSQLIFFQLGGALNERPPDDGAVGNRNTAFVCNIAGAWPPNDPNGPAHKAWVRKAWDAIRPFSTGGVYVNFQSADEGDDRVRAAYGDNYPRLLEAKHKYDPGNLFRVNRNIQAK